MKFSCSSCFLSPAYIQVTSPSWCPLWSWRAMCLCGCLLSASTKCVSPSAPTLWWRYAPRALGHRLMFSGWVGFICPHSDKNIPVSSQKYFIWAWRRWGFKCSFHYDLSLPLWLDFWGVSRLLQDSSSMSLVEGKKISLIFSVLVICASSVLLDVFEILGKIDSNPINLFVSETRKNPTPNKKKSQTNHTPTEGKNPKAPPNTKILTQNSQKKKPPKTHHVSLTFRYHLIPKVLSSKMDIIFLVLEVFQIRLDGAWSSLI